MTESTHRVVESLARICDGPPYDGRGVPADQPYAYTHRTKGRWACARCTGGRFVAVMCDAPSLPSCDKNIDMPLAANSQPVAVPTAGRLRGWLAGLSAGGFTLGRFGYTIVDLAQLASALRMPFIGD